MLKGFQYRCYPTISQRAKIAQHFGCCRFVWNWALHQKIQAYQTEQKTLSCINLITQLPILKRQTETVWLADVDSQALQMALRNLDNAFQRFFSKQNGFPKFKSRKYPVQSCQFPQRVKVNFDANTVTFPKIGAVRTKLHRRFAGTVKTVTLRRTATGKYFVSVLVDTADTLPKAPRIQANTTLGIDLGLTHFAIYSNGVKIDNPRHLRRMIARLTVLQRRLSRKQIGGHNRNKARQRVALLHERIANARRDFLHKLTHSLTHTDGVDTLALETLNIQGMMKNHTLAQAIGDVSWSMFNTLLEYKAAWSGKNIVRIGQFEPSSKVCSHCGFVNHALTLQDRSWTCPSCQTNHDRDVNAAVNIKQFALLPQNLVRPGRPESTPAELPQ